MALSTGRVMVFHHAFSRSPASDSWCVARGARRQAVLAHSGDVLVSIPHSQLQGGGAQAHVIRLRAEHPSVFWNAVWCGLTPPSQIERRGVFGHHAACGRTRRVQGMPARHLDSD